MGKLYDDRGNRMSPSFSAKNGVRYRFYISSALLRGQKAQAGSVGRVSATEIESAVLAALQPHQEQPAFLFGHVRCEKVLTNGIGKNGRIMQTKMRHGAPVGAEHHNSIAHKLANIVGADPTGDLLEQGRLARAAWADKCSRMAGLEGQVDGFTKAAAVGRLPRDVLQGHRLQDRRKRR